MIPTRISAPPPLDEHLRGLRRAEVLLTGDEITVPDGEALPPAGLNWFAPSALSSLVNDLTWGEESRRGL
jgi:hypothetical protein